MKRLITILLMLSLLFLPGGCGGGKAPVDDPSTSPAGGENDQAAQSEESTPSEEPPKTAFNPLTGQMVYQAGPFLLAVMINNAPQARPQTGLTGADVVYEIEMEGLMTRFVSFYYGDPPENAGPVRSARPYVMMLAKEWDAYYAHVGGSDDAFAKVKEWGIRDIDDVRGHPGFWLDKTRNRPHNTYLNLEKALTGKKENGSFHDWEFADPPTGLSDYRQIGFYYDKSNQPSYVFSEEEGLYLRYINGEPHVDRETGEQVKTSNIIVQYAKHYSTGDALKHIEVKMTGEGNAEYFLGGRYETGTWKKKDLGSPTEFFDAEGNPVKLVKGRTWIQVVKTGRKVNKKVSFDG